MVLLDTPRTTTPHMFRFADMERFFSLEAEEFRAPVRFGGRRARDLVEVAGLQGLGVFHLDGARMSSQSGLFEEFSASLQFPDYFGSNWNALDECLADLDWLDFPGYLLVIDSGDSVLRDEGVEVRGVFDTLLEGISREWANSPPGIVFRTIFVIGE